MFHNYMPREAVCLTFKKDLIESTVGRSCNNVCAGIEQYKGESSYFTNHLAPKILDPYYFSILIHILHSDGMA